MALNETNPEFAWINTKQWLHFEAGVFDKRKNSSLEMKPLFRVHPNEGGIGLLNKTANLEVQSGQSCKMLVSIGTVLMKHLCMF